MRSLEERAPRCLLGEHAAPPMERWKAALVLLGLVFPLTTRSKSSGRCLTYSRPLTNELLGSEGNDLR